MSNSNNNDETVKALLRLNKYIRELFIQQENLTVEHKRELFSIAQLVFLENREKLNIAPRLFGTDEEFAKLYEEIIRPEILLRFTKYLNVEAKECSSILSDYFFAFPEKAITTSYDNDANMITIARKFIISSEEGRERIFRFLSSMIQGNTLLFGPNNISVAKIEKLYNYLQWIQTRYPSKKSRAR